MISFPRRRDVWDPVRGCRSSRHVGGPGASDSCQGNAHGPCQLPRHTYASQYRQSCDWFTRRDTVYAPDGECGCMVDASWAAPRSICACAGCRCSNLRRSWSALEQTASLGTGSGASTCPSRATPTAWSFSPCRVCLSWCLEAGVTPCGTSRAAGRLRPPGCRASTSRTSAPLALSLHSHHVGSVGSVVHIRHSSKCTCSRTCGASSDANWTRSILSKLERAQLASVFWRSCYVLWYRGVQHLHLDPLVFVFECVTSRASVCAMPVLQRCLGDPLQKPWAWPPAAWLVCTSLCV